MTGSWGKLDKSRFMATSGLSWLLAWLLSACAPVTVSMREAIREGELKDAVEEGRSWLKEKSDDARPAFVAEVERLLAEARLLQAKAADKAEAYRAFASEFRWKAHLKDLRDEAFGREAVAVLRDEVLPDKSLLLLNRFVSRYEGTAAAEVAMLEIGRLELIALKEAPDVEGLRAFRERFGSVRDAEALLAEALTLETGAELRRVLAGRKLQDIHVFRERYQPPAGGEADIALRRREVEIALEAVRTVGSAAAWNGFIRTYSTWPEASEGLVAARDALDELAFKAAEASGVDALDGFGASHPTAKWQSRVEAAILARLMRSFEQFLKGDELSDPDVDRLLSESSTRPALAAALSSRRDDLEEAARERDEAPVWRLMMALAPDDSARAVAAEELERTLWERVEAEADEASLLAYLGYTPTAARSAEAEARYLALQEIRRAEERNIHVNIRHVVARGNKLDIYANVINCRGENVSGIKRENFRVFHALEDQPVVEFLGVDDARPLDVTFAIDLSGSMETEQSAVRSSVQQFADRFSFRMRQLSLGLITFNEAIVERQRPVLGETSFQRWIGDMTQTSGGAGEDGLGALLEANRMFDAVGERVVILMTDEKLQSNATAQRLLAKSAGKSPCVSAEQASRCVQGARSAGALRGCVGLLNRVTGSRWASDQLNRCMRIGGFAYCKSIFASVGQNAMGQCAGDVTSWSPAATETVEQLRKRGTRAFFVVSEGAETFHELAGSLGGRAYEVPDNTSDEAPYTKALFDIADLLSSQYIISVPQPAGGGLARALLQVVVHPETVLRRVGGLAASDARGLHVGGTAACPEFTAVGALSTRYRTEDCGKRWTAVGLLGDPGLRVEAMAQTSDAEALRFSDGSVEFRSWPDDAVKTTLPPGSAFDLYSAASERVWILERGVDGASFVERDMGGAAQRALPLGAQLSQGGARPLVLHLPSQSRPQLCFTMDLVTRSCRGSDDDTWVTSPVTGLPRTGSPGGLRYAGDVSGRPLDLVTSPDGRIYRSIDAGASWQVALDVRQAVRPDLSVGLDGILCAQAGALLRCSEDGGRTWDVVGGAVKASAGAPAFLGNRLFAFAEDAVQRADRVQIREVPSSLAFFATSSADPSSRITPFLREIVERAQRDQSTVVRVEGHADSRGDTTSNQELSERRARSVADQLLALGMPPERVEVLAFGESQPVVDSRGQVQLERSRRVELRLLESAPSASWFGSDCDE